MPNDSESQAHEFVPIGALRTPFDTIAGMPLQSVAASEVEGWVDVLPRYAEGLRDLDGFSHIHLLTWLHRAPVASDLVVVPFLDDQPRGVFATRSPRRPNPIGLSVVRLLSIEAASLRVAGVDLLDGTPVLDIKPYVPAFDEVAAERIGWLAGRAGNVHAIRADDRLEPHPTEDGGAPGTASIAGPGTRP